MKYEDLVKTMAGLTIINTTMTRHLSENAIRRCFVKNTLVMLMLIILGGVLISPIIYQICTDLCIVVTNDQWRCK